MALEKYEAHDAEMHGLWLESQQQAESQKFHDKQKDDLDELHGDVASTVAMKNFIDNEFSYVSAEEDVDQDALRKEFKPEVGEYEFNPELGGGYELLA